MLKKIFTFDAMFAGGSGVLLLAGSGPFADLLGWDRWVVATIGAALIAYFPLLFTVVRTGNYFGALAKLTFAADIGWVLGSAAVIVLLGSQTESAGKWFIAAAAAVVADIGLVKFIGWRKEASSAPTRQPSMA